MIARPGSDRRRGALGLLLLFVAVAALVLAVLSKDSGAQSEDLQPVASGDYRINAIFDTAKGIIPGQVLKIAGARAGTVDDVTLTEDFKARIEMTTDGRFAPFRADASCSIKPEGLISERFVQCDPGSPDAGPLREQDGVPTVPVDRTEVPIAITDLFNVFDLPVRQRFSVVVASLGLGVAGRGDDLNEVLRRANPTLKLVRDVLQRLDRDKQDLEDAVAATDAVVAELAKRPERAGDFVAAASNVVTETAEHRSALQRGIRTLPALLDEAEPSLDAFERFAAQGTPLLRDLRTSAPQAGALLDQIAPFAAKARPALRALGTTSTTGVAVARRAAPVVALLKSFAGAAVPTGTQLAETVVSLRDRGVTESLLEFVHNSVGFTGRYDDTSHVAPATVFFDPQCSTFAQTTVAHCDANYSRTAAVTRTPAGRRKQARRPAAKAPSSPLPTITLPEVRGLPQLGGRSTDTDDGPVQGLLDYLLG